MISFNKLILFQNNMLKNKIVKLKSKKSGKLKLNPLQQLATNKRLFDAWLEIDWSLK